MLYRPNEQDAGLLDVLIELLDAAGVEGQREQVQNRVYSQIERLVTHTYTDSEIDGPQTMPLSLLSTPVFDIDGNARYEIQLAPYAVT